MKKILLPIVATLMLGACSTSNPELEETSTSLKMIENVDFSHVKINDSFWSPRLEKHALVTLPVCIDQIENQTGRMQNFINAAKGEGQHSGIFFDDSDVYKALEGIAYSLKNFPNPELEALADRWIDNFAAAQQPDGYINTFYTLTGLENRWCDMDKHEMYCAGHMIEAAVAYYQVTGKRKMLDVCIRMADHMMNEFGPDKRDWVPGHEEIELALVKLYKVTGEEKYLDFAHWLLEERGHGYGARCDGHEWNAPYYQDDMPVSQLTDIGGHAVRSMYLYCGMSDVAAAKNDSTYMAALHRVWDDVVLRNMYVTGGIGSSEHNEGFTQDYDLPNKEAYCETCASVGMVLWNSRMNQFTGDAKYIDVLERSMYNGALAGVSLEGDKFFYVNPLESDGDHHRQAWYGCACCPSQVSRFLPSIGNYIYGTSEDALWVNLFIGNEAEIAFGSETLKVRMETNYPWEGVATLFLDTPFDKEIRWRVPDWCDGQAYFGLNGEPLIPNIENGYAIMNEPWKAGDELTLSMNMSVKMVAADPRVKADEGKRAMQRGPLVYCLEEIDNTATYENAQLDSDAQFDCAFEPELLNGVETITAETANGILHFIPYYSWDNREAGRMKVWVDYNE